MWRDFILSNLSIKADFTSFEPVKSLSIIKKINTFERT